MSKKLGILETGFKINKHEEKNSKLCCSP